MSILLVGWSVSLSVGNVNSGNQLTQSRCCLGYLVG